MEHRRQLDGPLTGRDGTDSSSMATPSWFLRPVRAAAAQTQGVRWYRILKDAHPLLPRWQKFQHPELYGLRSLYIWILYVNLAEHSVMLIVSLDRRSRQTIRNFFLQLGIGCVLVAGPSMLGLRQWTDSARLLALVFAVYSVCDVVRAVRSRDRLIAPSLNFWDEAVAFSGCAYLLRGIINLHS